MTPDGLDGAVPGGYNATSFMWPVTGQGFAFLSFAVPADMESFRRARVVILPESSSPAPEEYQVYLEAKRGAEVVSSVDWSISLGNTATLNRDEILEIDITPAFDGVFDGTSPGNDYVGLFFWFSGGTSKGAGRVLGLRVEYEGVPQDYLAIGSVGSSEIRDDSITATDLATGSVGAAEIAAGAVASSEVLDGSLTASDLATGSVGAAQIAAGAVGTSEIQDESITAADLAANSVGGAEIQAGAVGPDELAPASVLSVHVSPGQIGQAQIATNGIGSAEIAPGAVGSSEIADGSVAGVDVADASLTQADILDGAGAAYQSPLASNPVLPTGAHVVVLEDTITAPAPGAVLAWASGTIWGPNARVGCSLTTGVVVDTFHNVQTSTGSDITEEIFGMTRGFSQAPGTTTYRLVCASSRNSPTLWNPELTLLYVPRLR